MAMMSGDRASGTSYSYTITRVPYEMSALTKQVFEQLSAGTSGERLWSLLSSGSNDDLARFRKDLEVAKDQDFSRGNKDLLDAFQKLGEMAAAVVESRKPGARLLAQVMELLHAGTTPAELGRLLAAASKDALRELPQQLDKLVASASASQSQDAEQLKKLAEILKVMVAGAAAPAASGGNLQGAFPAKEPLGNVPASSSNPSPRMEASSRQGSPAGVRTPTAVRRSDVNCAAQLNIQYQDDLKRRQALPWWRRMLIPKPKRPEGI